MANPPYAFVDFLTGSEIESFPYTSGTGKRIFVSWELLRACIAANAISATNMQTLLSTGGLQQFLGVSSPASEWVVAGQNTVIIIPDATSASGKIVLNSFTSDYFGGSELDADFSDLTFITFPANGYDYNFDFASGQTLISAYGGVGATIDGSDLTVLSAAYLDMSNAIGGTINWSTSPIVEFALINGNNAGNPGALGPFTDQAKLINWVFPSSPPPSGNAAGFIDSTNPANTWGPNNIPVTDIPGLTSSPSKARIPFQNYSFTFPNFNLKKFNK